MQPAARPAPDDENTHADPGTGSSNTMPGAACTLSEDEIGCKGRAWGAVTKKRMASSMVAHVRGCDLPHSNQPILTCRCNGGRVICTGCKRTDRVRVAREEWGAAAGLQIYVPQRRSTRCHDSFSQVVAESRSQNRRLYVNLQSGAPPSKMPFGFIARACGHLHVASHCAVLVTGVISNACLVYYSGQYCNPPSWFDRSEEWQHTSSCCIQPPSVRWNK